MTAASMSNLLSLTDVPLSPGSEEFFETLLQGNGKFKIERIVSHGHVSPEGFWYDQKEDEWVLVAEGEARLLFDDGREVALARGDHLLIPAGQKHRVVHTSSPCVWLAIFAGTLTPRRSPTR